MEICESCGRAGGVHTDSCKTAFLKTIHPSHDIQMTYNDVPCCRNCETRSVPSLVAECSHKKSSEKRLKLDLVPEDVYLKDGLVWALYLWDHIPTIVSIHVSSEDAVRENTNNYSIMPWKIGTDFQEAVREWEARNSGRQ